MCRFFVLLVSVALVLAATTACLAEQLSVQQVGENAKIDWTNLCYIVEGQGAMPSAKEEPNRARAQLKAKDYAKMDALANLLMAVEGTAISYESVGKDYMATTTIRQKIEGFVKNVQIEKSWKESVEGDTVVVVQVRAPMFKKNGPGTIIAEELVKDVKPVDPTTGQTIVETNVKVVLKPDKAVAVTTTTTVQPSVESKPYTGLIVDASGYKLDRCMSPKIRRQDGSEVWGTVKSDADMVLDRGIVAYSASLTDARKNARVGSNPLIIRAIGRAGGRFYSDPIISDNDAELLLAENAKSGFLDSFSVLFVKDPALK